MSLDVALLVPFQPTGGWIYDSHHRATTISHINLPALAARAEFEGYLGQSLRAPEEAWGGVHIRIGGSNRHRHRSASAVVLATHLESAGLSWCAIDPGAQELSYWRRECQRLRARNPRVVAICTTFTSSAPWLRALFALVREILPDTRIACGGYYYTTSTEGFLSLDADVFCIGEGEVRLPQIVRALCQSPEDLEAIPGLYLKRPDGRLHSTGPRPPLDLEALSTPDWTLAERIEPAVRLDRHELVYVVETQRGCVFKCAFCTYRTLADIEMMSVERAVDAICDTVPPGAAEGSEIDLVDATGTFPTKRWTAILERLIERGGAPLPMAAYARISDITEENAELMARAGVQSLFIGQESASQTMLNLMRKGTRAGQLIPAVRTLGRHGIQPNLSFIHGFPGETSETLEETRLALLEMNRGLPEPACWTYRVEAFAVYDFASVAQQPEMAEFAHYMDYSVAETSGLRNALDEVLATAVVTSRDPEAPVCEALLDWARLPVGDLKAQLRGPHRREVFRWLKAVERGIGIFAERALYGTPVDRAELRRTSAIIKASLPRKGGLSRGVFSARSRVVGRLLRGLGEEWRSEPVTGPRWQTRTALALNALRDTHRGGGPVLRALLGDPWMTNVAPEPRSPVGVREHARDLVALSVPVAKRRKVPAGPVPRASV